MACLGDVLLGRMAWTWRSGTRQEFRLSWEITGSLGDFRYKFSLSPRHSVLRAAVEPD